MLKVLRVQDPLLAGERRVTLRDVQLILPTLAILLLTVVIILTVIPYAFSSVLRQMEAVRALEAAGVKPSTFSEYSTQLTFNI